eukprot:3376153-Alexandrium_andersonii.AAC.1
MGRVNEDLGIGSYPAQAGQKRLRSPSEHAHGVSSQDANSGPTSPDIGRRAEHFRMDLDDESPEGPTYGP